jgi:threonine dehydrogenase-like Zn-dependent dehydrogenase
MRALTLDYRERTLIERNVPEPVIAAPDGVLFAVRDVGVCGTDLELTSFRFGFPPRGSEYLIIGHEAAGQVIAAGDAALAFEPGDWVVPMIRRACEPPCRSCAAGRRDLCLSGTCTERGIFGAHGYFAEFAVDAAADLVSVPASIARYAVLIEPLSVVEKAVSTALRLHRGGAETALVVGAGAIGLLTVLVLRCRGLRATVHSIEPQDSPRARLVENAGAEYRTKVLPKSDIVIEAAGAAEAAMKGLMALAPLGVMIVLGAAASDREFPLVDLIVNNQVVAGSVNAGPEHFRQAAADLATFPAPILDRLIRREEFGDWRKSLAGPSRHEQPKTVHVIG